MPKVAAPLIAGWIAQAPCQFRISKGRTSKYGDYRAPFKDKGHRISVNHNLNPYAFLVTTVHEFAHLKTWEEHRGKVKPHGREWKVNFKALMQPFFEKEVFPSDVRSAIRNYLENPSASSCTDMNLFRILGQYDKPKENVFRVESVPEGSCFAMSNGRTFRKGVRLRKRYLCRELSSGRDYLFSPVAEVYLLPA